MTIEAIKNYFSALRVKEKIYFLSLLAHDITVSARGAYPGGTQTEEVIKKLCTMNEIEHNVTGQLVAMLANEDRRYPDETFIDILFEKARDGDCEEDLIAAFKLVQLVDTRQTY